MNIYQSIWSYLWSKSKLFVSSNHFVRKKIKWRFISRGWWSQLSLSNTTSFKSTHFSNLSFKYKYSKILIHLTYFSLKFEHEFGRVRYSVNANIIIPWALDKHATRSFTVISHYDLNRDLNAKQSFGVSDNIEFGCGPCASNPIKTFFSVDRSNLQKNKIYLN